ncbi:MAG: hypothetical protein U1E66_09110 [Rhodospirillales bacterium]
MALTARRDRAGGELEVATFGSSLRTVNDKSGTRQACHGPAIAAAGLFAWVAAGCAGSWPAAGPEPPGFGGGQRVLVVDETQSGGAVYDRLEADDPTGWPGVLSLFPEGPFVPDGYFGYPYRYRPYGTHPPGTAAGSCAAACGGVGVNPPPPGFAAPAGRGGAGAFGRSPVGQPPSIGPQPPSIGPQPPPVGPRMSPRSWQGPPSR